MNSGVTDEGWGRADPLGKLNVKTGHLYLTFWYLVFF